MLLTAAEHLLKPDGMHTGEGEGRGGRWNNEWKKFMADNPSASAGQIIDKAIQMVRDFNLTGRDEIIRRLILEKSKLVMRPYVPIEPQ